MKKYIILLFLFTSICVNLFSQRKIEILNTNSLVFEKKKGADLRRLYGNVKFKHNDVIMFCDSAYFYARNNVFNAYSNVHIIQNAAFHIYADSLYYDGKMQYAKLRGKVKMIDGETTLTTNHLDYDLANDVGVYYNGGRIIDAENILVSENGKYLERTKEMYFKKRVILNNPEYVIVTDTLKYNTSSEIAYFLGPSRIVADENFIYTENGWYNTKTNISQFKENAYLNSKEYFIYGDNLHYDRNKGIGQAFGHVHIKDTIENLHVYGEYTLYKEKQDYCLVKDSLLIVKAFTSDSLFIHADTLTIENLPKDTTLEDTNTYRIIKAYHHVRFFKDDLQGKCDSIAYNFKDSLIYLEKEPVIWSGVNQIIGTKIRIHIRGDGADRIFIDRDSYLVQQDDSLRYNQVKGNSMIGYLKNKELYKLDVNKNGETVYFLRDGIDLIGVNKASCENITIHFKESKIQSIVFKSSPSGTLYPPLELSLENTKLNNFVWLNYVRPMNKNDIFIWKK